MAGALESEHDSAGDTVLPSRDALLGFLLTRASRPDGAVAAWVSPTVPGYSYPEAAGFVLALLAREGGAVCERERAIADWLAQQVSGAGGVGRNGTDYLFDTAIAYAGLTARPDGRSSHHDYAAARMLEFIADAIERASATGRTGTKPERRWSTAFSPHLLRVSLALRNAPVDTAGALCTRLGDALLPLYTDGRFRAHAETNRTYAHANCYAVEGLTLLEGLGRPGVRALLERCAAWLASVQLPAGGVPSWHDGHEVQGPPHADATAQAVRIWVHVDAERYRDACVRALGHLARIQHRWGGVLYHESSPCVNTWATVFTIQAIDWFRAGRPTHRLI